MLESLSVCGFNQPPEMLGERWGPRWRMTTCGWEPLGRSMSRAETNNRGVYLALLTQPRKSGRFWRHTVTRTWIIQACRLAPTAWPSCSLKAKSLESFLDEWSSVHARLGLDQSLGIPCILIPKSR